MNTRGVFRSPLPSREVVSFDADVPVSEARARLGSELASFQHQGFPLVDGEGRLVGVLTRRDLLDPSHAGDQPLRALLRRLPVAIYEDCTLRDAADHMVNHNIGRLPVLTRQAPTRLVGMLTRSDILSAYRQRLRDLERAEPVLRLPWRR